MAPSTMTNTSLRNGLEVLGTPMSRLSRLGNALSIAAVAVLILSVVYSLVRPGPDAPVRPRLLSGSATTQRVGSFHVGDRVGLGPYVLTIDTVTDPFAPPSGSLLPGDRLPGERLIRIVLAVENNSNSELDLGLTTIGLKLPDGRSTGDRGAIDDPQGGYPHLPYRLAPHSRATGSVYFGVPKLEGPGTLLFSPFVTNVSYDSPNFASMIRVALR